MRVTHGSRRSAVRRQRNEQGAIRVGWLLVMAVIALLVAGVVALWATPPGWLAGPGGAVSAWVRGHVLTAAGAGVLLGIAGLVMPFLLAWWPRPEVPNPRGQAHDRELMRKRVRSRWIKGVLEQSLADEARIRLGLTRRLDTIGRPDMTIRRGGQSPKPLPAGTPVSAVFAEAGGALLILGAPGSGKTTALLELTRDLLDQADAGDTRPMPAVFNLSSWAAQRTPLAAWLIDELHKRYDVPRSIATRWVNSGEILPLLDGLDEVAEPHRAACVEAINAFRTKHGLVPFAVCSRTEEYSALAARLRVEDAVELRPPTPGQIYDYLEATGASSADVRAALEADPTCGSCWDRRWCSASWRWPTAGGRRLRCGRRAHPRSG
ncbi:MAG: NACHT domain-containing protein [Egibacteraceae bacterium]